jgi:hypothetical protein
VWEDAKVGEDKQPAGTEKLKTTETETKKLISLTGSEGREPSGREVNHKYITYMNLNFILNQIIKENIDKK